MKKEIIFFWFVLTFVEISGILIFLRSFYIEGELKYILGFSGLFIFIAPIISIIFSFFNKSPTSQTSPNGDFSNEKEHNIRLKDNSNELSQISSNDEISLNNNIKLNSVPNLRGGVQLNKMEIKEE